MSTGKGLHLGHFYDDATGRYGERQVLQTNKHGLFVAPSGVGKGTRFLTVNLLSDCLDDRSVLVIDPKSELTAICAKHRHQLGHDVKILDPFGKLKEIAEAKPDVYRYLIEHGLTESVGFEPLAALNADDANFYDDAAALGEALIKIEGKDPHWSESAQGLLVGLIMWEKFRNEERASLENVRELLTEADVFEDVVGADGKTRAELVRGLAATARQMVDRGGYEIASLAGRFAKGMTNELASIQSTADTQTRWLLSKRMRANLKTKPTIDFAQLKQKPTSLFVILPAERMRTNSVWLRLVIVSALRALYRPGGVRTVMMIDEMAALGHLGPLEDAFALVRGYRVQIAGFVQDLGQLKALYNQRWESFLANAGVVVGLAPNDLTTAEWMSRRSGQTTALAKGLSESAGIAPGGSSERDSTSWQQVGRPTFFPHQLFGLEQGTGLLWLAGMADTVKFWAPGYYELAQCAARALPNPYRDDD